jgi:outer membrane protein assembly factor BamB
MKRRQYLAGVVLGTSGCLRLESGGSTTTRRTDAATDGSRTTSTETGTSTTTEEPTETNTTTNTSDPALSVSGTWPRSQFDNGNTGHNPDGEGPTGSVETVWTFERRGDLPSARRRDAEWPYFVPVLADGRLYATSQDNSIYALDPGTGAIDWRFQEDANEDKSRKSTATVANGTVFAEGPKDALFALDAESGAEQWRLTFSTPGIASQVPLVVGDSLYVCAGNVYALNAADGAPRWVREDLNTRQAVHADETLYVTRAGPNGGLLALDRDSGATKWTVDGPQAPPATDGTVVAAAAGTVVTDAQPELVVTNAADGSVRWRRRLPAYVSAAQSPAIANGRLFVGLYDRKVQAFDVEDGSKLWEYRTLGDAIVAPPTVVDGHVYFGGWSGKVHCVTASEGTRKWSYALDTNPTSPTAVDDVAFVGTSGGRIHALAESN